MASRKGARGGATNGSRSLGTPIAVMNRMPRCLPSSLPPLVSTRSHVVLFTRENVEYEDKWDKKHVRLPCSPQDVCVAEEEMKTRPRWEVIQAALRTRMDSSYDLQKAIMTYNEGMKWNFESLHVSFTTLSKSEASRFFNHVLPAMVELALQLPALCPLAIPLLFCEQEAPVTLTLSQAQIACLLANAFFCTFPLRNGNQLCYTEYAAFNNINFENLYGQPVTGPPHVGQKILTLIHYFKRVTESMPTGVVTFHRQKFKTFPDWGAQKKPLTRLHVTSEGTIEDGGQGMSQVDFADPYIGGLVLDKGCVQEEILFLTCPELIVSCLFTEVIPDDQALIITGCERFSNYTGYARSYHWAGDFKDQTPRDSWGRLCRQVIAIDATHYKSSTKADQYKPVSMQRELNKAYCGFADNRSPAHLPAIASGNWGCGVFNGDPRLKALLQMMAAAHAHRDLAYFTFNDAELADDIHTMHTLLTENNITLGELWNILCGYHKTPDASKKNKNGIYKFIYEQVKNNKK